MTATIIAAVIAGLVLGAILGRFLGRASAATNDAGAEQADLEKLRAAAEAEIAEMRRVAQLEREEQAEKLRRDAEATTSLRRKELAQEQDALAARERELDKLRRDSERRAADLAKKEKTADSRTQQIEAALSKAEEGHAAARRKLEEVARLSEADARKRLEDEVRGAALAGVAAEIKRIEEEAEQEASMRAKTIVAAAIQRYASEFVHERTVAVVPLPSDDLKGRLIGREGRNIRALEAASGIDIIIDDSSEALTISCFNPVRREIARLAISALVADGRIHPTRIEEVVRKAEKDVDKVCKEAGEQALFDLGIHRVHPALVLALGRLKYRQSYAQNVLLHSVEVGYLAGLMAAELGQNVKLARRAGLLHDIGKSVDHEQEGGHADVGAQFARRHGESPKVCQAIAAHHGDVAPTTVLDHIVAAANALSAARPGARREQLASYIKRLEDLEALCGTHAGVERAFALQSGREIRVMVENDKVDDVGALMLSKELARKIQQEATYAGSVRVVVVRETRASDYAR